MISPIRWKKKYTIKLPTSVSFSRTEFANLYFSRLESYFNQYPGVEIIERFEERVAGTNQKKVRRVHDVTAFRAQLTGRLRDTVESAEEAYCYRKTESLVSADTRKRPGSALDTLKQITKKSNTVNDDEAGSSRTVSSSEESSPASLTFSEIDFDGLDDLSIHEFLLKMKNIFLEYTAEFNKDYQKEYSRTLIRIATECLLLNLDPLEFGLLVRAKASGRR